ncbi:sn-glycerol-3-phosphate ABC transporter substrate-binding protein UgpB [Paracoccus sp. (in: a-proteobacteria)]|uniref:sn-glycerol-3-phosphate ABC transporter substrate-binding protein UgpB n=1 Tax=Paracoccus sp. TaxID=267 RepID=UPI0026E0B244|nr:sn-glycerol-3-phosphate ABC transporter substrate-binding protein UgpB [Paracoccus sp. (in: a-proteobacteria)]MDO5646879.1 sn-glycerol-3-phosphate ABC transporter substrate-binding protein UgpB [Paracoccus sp. (in: a-proteobacteria)]
MKRFTTASAIALVASMGAAQAETTIEWWHAMGGELGAKLEEIVQNFNDSQDQYRVVSAYKGTYPETMTAAIAAFRANQQPAIVQVFEVGTGTMMAAEGAIVPVYELMQQHGQNFDQNAFLPSVVGYYTDTNGNMLSMPFNSSTPILYYNKTVFEKAGLDPEQAPKTWADVEAFSKQIKESGAATCGFTTGWVSWIQTENFSAWHNQAIGTEENGFGGLDARLTVNGPVQVKHWNNLKRWADEGIFKYGGPVGGNDAPPMFYSQECAMIMNSSASRAGVIANATDFELGFGMLPYYDDVEGAPQNSIIGGATLWVLSGRPDAEYAAVAAFFDYLTQPEVQADWAEPTGYLPITQAAYDLSTERGFFANNPGAETGIKQITLNEPTANSKGLRFGNYVQIRGVIDEEFEQLMSGSKDGQAALDAVVARGNALIEEFQAANQ